MPVQLPPELTPVRGLTEWSIDPYALALIVLACAAYLLGVRRVRLAGENWPAGRTIAFCAGGAGLAFIATSSFLAVYWPVLFFVRAFQTVVLLLAVPLFIMLGRPLSLVIAAAPKLGTRLEAAIASRIARMLTFPAITGLALVLTPFVLYYSPWYAAGFHNFAVRELTGLVLVLPGLVFFWTLLRVDPVPRQYPYLVALWVTAAEVVGDAALGLSVIVDRNLIAGRYYHALCPRPGLVAAPDPERPAGGRRQLSRSDEFVRLQTAPGRYVGLRRRVIGQHLNHLTDANLADSRRQHDDRLRAFLAQRIDP
jgi:cytochrome c oxidase assembly factor CtaG